MDAFNTTYENLHVLGYYGGGTSVKAIKDGMDNVKKIIALLTPRA